MSTRVNTCMPTQERSGEPCGTPTYSAWCSKLALMQASSIFCTSFIISTCQELSNALRNLAQIKLTATSPVLQRRKSSPSLSWVLLYLQRILGLYFEMKYIYIINNKIKIVTTSLAKRCHEHPQLLINKVTNIVLTFI